MKKQHGFYWWHLGYGSVIALLIGYIVHRHFRDRELMNLVHRTLIDARKNAVEHRNSLLSGLWWDNVDLPDTDSRRLLDQSRHVDSLREIVQETINACLQSSDEPGLHNKQRSVIMPIPTDKIELMQRTADSVKNVYVGWIKEPEVRLYKVDIMGDTPGKQPGWLARYLRSARSDESLLALETLQLRAELAELTVLEDLAIESAANTNENWLEPMLSTANPAPRAGDLFEAKVFLGERLASRRVQIWINGEPQETTDGVARYQRRFSKVANEVLKVRIDVQNPMVRTTFTYNQDFHIPVLPPAGGSKSK